MELSELQAQVAYLKLVAEKALDMAMDALVKVQAMKESTHQVVAQPLNPEVTEFINSLKPEPEPESEEVPVMKKLSPFNLSGFAARRAAINGDQDFLNDEGEG